jgi:hypothetical protein
VLYEFPGWLLLLHVLDLGAQGVALFFSRFQIRAKSVQFVLAALKAEAQGANLIAELLRKTPPRFEFFLSDIEAVDYLDPLFIREVVAAKRCGPVA